MQPRATRLLKEKQQAQELNCSLRHLINLRRKRLIPFIRLGQTIRYDPVAVEKALEKLTVKELA
jgi:hypothetical protein